MMITTSHLVGGGGSGRQNTLTNQDRLGEGWKDRRLARVVPFRVPGEEVTDNLLSGCMEESTDGPP